MIAASPIVAMLWENWRLSRVEAAQRFGLGLVAAAGALVLFDAGATIAFWILIAAHAFIWFSIAKLNGGRFADGYKPGFPLYLLYVRPIPTAVLVGVAMAYDAISCTVLYLVSAALLSFAFGQPLPLFSVALCLVAYHLSYTCVQWSTRNRVVQWVGSFAFSWPLFVLLKSHVEPSLRVQFSFAENVVLVLIGILSIGFTIAGVARQRRGDAVASVPRAAGSSGFPNWLINLFRLPCPTTSATRAQVWFELKSGGLPVLAIGLATALLIFLLFAIAIVAAPVRTLALGITVVSVPVLLFGFGGNAFGVRRKQGRTYASAFEAITPCNTATLASLKLLVRSTCLLVALIAIGVSVWTASSYLGAWGEWLPDGKNNAIAGLLTLRQKIGDVFREFTGHTYAALAVIASIGVAHIVAWQATREALRARHPRLLLVVQWLPAVWGLAIILLTLLMRKGFGPVPLVDAIVRVTFWTSGTAMVLATIYLLWSGFAARALTIRYACGAVAISVAFGAAWLAGVPSRTVGSMLWLMLLIVMVGVLAPWSLNRIRHA